MEQFRDKRKKVTRCVIRNLIMKGKFMCFTQVSQNQTHLEIA